MIKDMTKGSPLKIIFSFSLPMLLSMFFQQLYNIVDSLVAGNFIGMDALAAVGASYPITVLFIAVATGASIGCSVVVSQIFGARQLAQMKSAVSTAVISLIVLSLTLTGVGLLICNPLIALLNTPSNIFDDSALYLRIYICGVIFLFLYNTATAIFTGLGDSKTPLYFLIFSSIFNIVLDLWFVISFQMGVAGVAWATFIAQGLSSVLAVTTLLLRLRKIRVQERYKVFDVGLLRRMSVVAIPSIMQQSFVSVGQLCVQGLINGFGSITVAGYSAAFKINMFAISVMTTMSSALSSFTAQNLGAGKLDRVRKGMKCGAGIALSIECVLLACVFLFGRNLIGLFVSSTEDTGEMLATGLQFLWIVAPFWLVVTVKNMCDAVMRGAGDMNEFMISTLIDLVLRVGCSYLLAPVFGFAGISWAYPIGWIVGTSLSVFYYHRGNWSRFWQNQQMESGKDAVEEA